MTEGAGGRDSVCRAMAYGCFTEKSEPPDRERAEAAAGRARPLWDELLADIRLRTRAAPVWRFYGRNHGWALAFKKAGKALAAVFPDEDAFTVLVVLTAAQADAASAAGRLSAGLRARMAGLPRFREGCWVFTRVASRDDLRDALALVAVRAGEPAALQSP